MASSEKPKKRPLPTGMRKRGGMYWSDFQFKGNRVRKPLAADLETAGIKLAALRAEVMCGGDGAIVGRGWKSICKRYFEARVKHLRTAKEVQRDIDHFDAFLNEVAWTDEPEHITEELAERFRAWRRTKVFAERRKNPLSNRTINKELGTVRAVLRWAASSQRRLIARNPLADMRPLPEDRPSKERRSLTAEEVVAVLGKLSKPMRDLISFVAGVGCRVDEAIGLTWKDYDANSNTVTLRPADTKSAKQRTLPLPKALAKLLERRLAEVPKREPMKSGPGLEGGIRNFSRDHVFVTARCTPFIDAARVLQNFYVACQKAKIPGGRPRGSVDVHSLRVTFVTQALDAGADLTAVSKMAGHHSAAFTLSRYDKATEAKKREAAESLPWMRSVTKMSQLPDPKRNKASRKGRQTRPLDF